jgi:hypothetical protein
MQIRFIGQGFIGKNMAADCEGSNVAAMIVLV